MQVVAPLGGVGGRLEVEVALGLQLPARPHALAQIFESRSTWATAVVRSSSRSARSRIGAGIVDHRRRDLVGRGLALVAGLGLVAELELLDVDPELAVGPLADPEGERGPGPWTITAVATTASATSSEARQPRSLPGDPASPSARSIRQGAGGPGRVWDDVCQYSWMILNSTRPATGAVPRGSVPGPRGPGFRGSSRTNALHVGS